MRRINDEEHRIARLQGVVYLLHHAPVELCIGFMYAGRIHQHNLSRGMPGLAFSLLKWNLQNSVNPCSRRLRFMRNDCKLLPQ